MHRLLAIAALVLSFGIPSAEAAKRVALVIGNDSYKSLPDLNNARTDARGMAAKLKELGWSVILKQDASRRDVSRSLADFEGRLKDAEVGLVFYAGHGIQKDGANYLVPSNAQIEVEEDLRLSTQQSPTCPCRCSPDQGAFFWSVSGRNPSISNAILTAAKHSNRTALLHWRNGNNLRPEFSSFWCL